MMRVQNLCVTQGRTPIVHDVSIEWSAAALHAIMGLNGAGKSTLLAALLGQADHVSGQVSWNQYDLVHCPSRVRAQWIAWVPQSTSMLFPLSVFDFVMLGRFARQTGYFPTPEDEAPVRQALQTCGLEAFQDRDFSTLSGRERQKALIARALAQDTPVILMDEPFNHLDVRNRLEVANLLEKLKRERAKTLICVLHDWQMVKARFDTVTFLKAGHVFKGPVAPQNLSHADLAQAFDLDSHTDIFG